ncbi:gamma-glutamylcyclotransferase family protein [Mucisphaera sp.]|uniref:gamma-glutamylcyclotransferase family protein n=1 Tax=Mucisphaera sp. TaxID=2913024 RepID=UPI003D12FDFF
MLYFAYGSNLDPQQMDDRCPGFQVHARARLANHRLCFPRACESWAGGVASIEPHPNHHVHGVLYQLTQDHIDTLDIYEDIAEGSYRREERPIEIESGPTLRVLTYIAEPDPNGPTPPSRQYLDGILRGARFHKLPAHYIAELEKIPILSPKTP